LQTAAAAKQQQIYDLNPIIRKERGAEPDPFIVHLDRGEFITATYFDKEQGRLMNVVFDDWASEGGDRFVVANSAQTDGEDLVMGQNVEAPAYLYEQGGADQLYESYSREPTERIDLGVDLKTQYTQMKTPQELTQTELAEQSKRKKARGENPAEDLTDFHMRFSGPFASLAFALISMPLSLRAPRDERLLGLILCFVLGLVYYTIFFVGKLMGYNEVLMPWLAAWMKDIVFGVIALFIFVFSRK
jgi:lipopolysaccharide export LptBFGC system permease protein LptF